MRGESIATRINGKKLYRILYASLKPKESEYVVNVAGKMERDNPFAVLVGIILSQNTNDKNSIRAFLELKKRLGKITPKSVLSISEDRLAEAIRIAGLHRQKTRAIREAAKRIIEAGGEKILVEKPIWELREFLLSIPGVGKKTADVFLAFYRKAPVFAVDTHAMRIAKRWRLVDVKAGYDEASKALLEYFGSEHVDEAHRLLIALGRRYCRARRPLCNSCPVGKYCPSFKS